jgi:peptide/nickel transport system permease protein
MKKENFIKQRERKWLQQILLRSFLVIVFVTIAVFFVIRLVPGDPAIMILGEHANADQLQKLHEKLNLDLPVLQQFGMFLKNLLTRADTGESIKYGISTRALIFRFAPVTLLLAGMSLVITFFATLLLAFTAATHKNGLLDQLIRIMPAFTHGMPVFWVGLIFILFFSVRLGWFPVGGLEEGIGGRIHSLILPAITVAFGQIPPLVRSLREQLLEVLDSDFVTTLRAAGIPKRTILWKHVLRNAFVPTLMLLGVNTSYLIGGTLVVEQVFAVKGMGMLLFEAISSRDFPLVQGIALYCAFFVVVISFLVEVISHRVDPRIRK